LRSLRRFFALKTAQSKVFAHSVSVVFGLINYVESLKMLESMVSELSESRKMTKNMVSELAESRKMDGKAASPS
jgi:hypothetical protein